MTVHATPVYKKCSCKGVSEKKDIFEPPLVIRGDLTEPVLMYQLPDGNLTVQFYQQKQNAGW